MRILYVEDNPLDADLLQRELARLEPTLQVDLAATYVEAVGKLAQDVPGPAAYEVVLADQRLPDGSGLNLLNFVQERGLNCAVVLLTGVGNDELVVTALKGGASDYVVKEGDYLARLPAVLKDARRRHQSETARQARPLRVLYAEHHAPDIDLTERHFARFAPHLHLEIAHSGESVSRRMSAPPPLPYDVLVLDYNLPAMNGLELIKEILQTRRLDLPIVLVTGQGGEDVALQALRLGALDYVVKSAGYLAKLPGIVENAFNRAQLAREQAALQAEHAKLLARQDELQQANAAIRQLNAELEQRVQERTAQLDAASADLRAANQELNAKNEELNALNTELGRAMRAKDEFLASMSHELRTPLTGILGLSETLRMGIYGPLGEKQLQALQNIQESGDHLLALITDILDLAKVEAGKMELEPGPVPVATVCQASLRLVSEQAAKKGLKLTVDLDSDVNLIQADERRLKQSLVNLLGNAVKFTPSGGQVGLEVRGDLPHRLVRFTVWDTGIGIRPEVMPRLFQPFVQLDSRLSRAHEGTGLGLSLVRRMVELHGGSVSVESDGVPGKGSRFTLSLPWNPADAQPPQQAHKPAAGRRGASIANSQLSAEIASQKPVILVADDNAMVIRMLSDFLETLACQVIVARDGAEAILQAQTHRPDLILLDIQMPGMDGLEAMRRLRALAPFATVPIIALTALAMPGDRERCLDAGANGYLAKPVSMQVLADAMNRLLAQPPG